MKSPLPPAPTPRPRGVARRAGALLAAAALLAVTGCASLGRPKPPEVTLDSVTAAVVGPGGARVRVRLAARNPNVFDLRVDSLDYLLALDGRTVGGGTLVQPVVLKANDVTPIDLDVRIDFAAMGSVIDRAARRGAVAYDLSGNVVLADGTRLPFHRDGDFKPTGRLVGPALPQ
ncbi:MAG: LEA type 2 family protein [Proteobacteria bacterium]|nr:LEA type 2 family protein [Pseudomonadota bacterium]